MKSPFQAVAVRYVHDVLTGEFVNIGVVLLCPEREYVGARFVSQWSRVTAAFPRAELPHIRRMATLINNACAQGRPGPTLLLPLVVETDLVKFLASVLPPDDSSIQFSPVIHGVTDDPARTLAELQRRYAEKHLPEDAERVPRTDADVWQSFVSKLVSKVDLLQGLSPITLRAPRSPYQHDFSMAWKNGVWNVAQPISFDLLDTRAISDKANLWTGRVCTLRPSEQNARIAFLVGMPPEGVAQPVRDAASAAVQILSENLLGEANVFTEDRSDDLAEKIAHDLTHRA